MLSLCFAVLCVLLCSLHSFFFFFNDTATTEIYTLSLHDALPISGSPRLSTWFTMSAGTAKKVTPGNSFGSVARRRRSEEHTSELQSLAYLVCRLLLEKKKKEKRTDVTDSCQSIRTAEQMRSVHHT